MFQSQEGYAIIVKKPDCGEVNHHMAFMGKEERDTNGFSGLYSRLKR